jgi:RNA polymerase sigma-70 factor, ECF subfamily
MTVREPSGPRAGLAGDPERLAGSLRRLRGGDRSALGELLDAWGEDLMRYLTALTGERESAEDLFQDTWVHVVERIGRYDPGRPFAPWLFRVARNLAYDHLRRKRRWRWIPLGGGPGEFEPAEAAPGPADDPVDRRREAARLLACLDRRSREMVWLRYWGDASYEEIAAITRVPVGTGRSRLHRARKKLAGVLQGPAEETA